MKLVLLAKLIMITVICCNYADDTINETTTELTPSVSDNGDYDYRKDEISTNSSSSNKDECDECSDDTSDDVPQVATKVLSLAQKAANEATAAQAAQQVAAQQASQQVKLQLADKALEASAAAEAAVAGKQSIVEQIEEEIRDAQMMRRKIKHSLKTDQKNFRLAISTAKGSMSEVRCLAEMLRLAESHSSNAQQAAQGAQEELSEQQKIIEHVGNRRQLLKKKLSCAREELGNTRKLVMQGFNAASQARADAINGRRMSVNSRFQPRMNRKFLITSLL